MRGQHSQNIFSVVRGFTVFYIQADNYYNSSFLVEMGLLNKSYPVVFQMLTLLLLRGFLC